MQPRSTSLLTLVHIRTLKMTDDVLAVRYSPNGKLLAVALLDSTVKVFYQDTLKFFLSLYGHKVCPLSNIPRPSSTSLTHSLTIEIAPSPLQGHLPRLHAHRDLPVRQERQALGPRLRGLPQVHLRARRERDAGRV